MYNRFLASKQGSEFSLILNFLNSFIIVGIKKARQNVSEFWKLYSLQYLRPKTVRPEEKAASVLLNNFGLRQRITGEGYELAGFTAASRIDSKKHDILDVLAGAAIGLGSNLLFTTECQQEHMELTFSNSEGDYLIGFNYKF